MASIRKLKTGRWQAQVYKAGKRASKLFDTKLAAKDWASYAEVQLKQEVESGFETGTFSKILLRYAKEVSPKKRGAKWEILRLNLIDRDIVSQTLLSDLKPAVLAEWRDRRLLQVSPPSVTREMQLLSHALNVAVDEWGWLPKNPIKGVKKPGTNPPRDRLIKQSEIDALMSVANYDLNSTPKSIQQRVVHCFLFALETAMRAGEIIGLDWPELDLDNRVATLIKTKNSDSRRVPLSSEAKRILELLPKNNPVFGLNSSQLDVQFRNLRDKANIQNLHFHDTRHEAVTRLSKKLDVLALARMVGHRNIAMLQIYYNETAEELAKRLD